MTTQTAAAVPRWAFIAAHLVPLVVLPSGLWRIGLAAGSSLGLVYEGEAVSVTGWEAVYVVGLSLTLEALAWLTLGLVRPWGERVPRWVPRIGGRVIGARAVIVVAGTGAAMLAAIWAFAFVNVLTLQPFGFTSAGWEVVFVTAYAPLLLWAPLLGAVTVAYRRRRLSGGGAAPARQARPRRA